MELLFQQGSPISNHDFHLHSDVEPPPGVLAWPHTIKTSCREHQSQLTNIRLAKASSNYIWLCVEQLNIQQLLV